ncbi:MAG TPA: hypothetical protein VL096_18850, partial [Pirellulaceae bacterium]|nr:hypothetical protein [Pirellulaceae bacterium]
MKRIRALSLVVMPVVIALGLWLFTTPALAVPSKENDQLRQRQIAQEKARAMAGELVSNILDIQIKQLKENGLDKLPIYGEIQGMRKNIDALVEAEMQEVVTLLVAAQEGTKEQRVAKLNQAREKIREVVISLMAERQKLYKRLQIAKIAAQIKQLIVMETKVWNVTKTLPELATEQREQLTLNTIEDQTDAVKVYYLLVQTLQDVSTWGGHAGAGCADGLRILKAAQVEQEMLKGGQQLGIGEFKLAATHEYNAIKGLRALLEKIEETQGLISSDREAALKMVREMLKEQEKLREQVKQNELSDKNNEALVEKQTEIQKELGKLAQALDKFPAAEPLIEQAKAAAFEATADLFDTKKAEAVAEQSKVIGSLAEIEEQLKHAADVEDANKSADQLAEEVAKLEAAKKTLEEVAKQQEKAEQAAAKDPNAAKQAENAVAAALEKLAEKELPGTIESRVADAKEAVADA